MATTKINIAGLDRVALLKALWQNTPNPMGIPNAAMPPFDMEAAREAVKEYIDYFCNKNIKCDLSRDEVNPCMYDLDAGDGAFARVVRSLQPPGAAAPQQAAKPAAAARPPFCSAFARAFPSLSLPPPPQPSSSLSTTATLPPLSQQTTKPAPQNTRFTFPAAAAATTTARPATTVAPRPSPFLAAASAAPASAKQQIKTAGTITAAAGVHVPPRHLCTFFHKASGAHWQGVLSTYAYNALMQHIDSTTRLRLTPKTCKVEQLREALECSVGEALKSSFACVSTDEGRIQPFLAVEQFLAPVSVDFPAAVQESVAASKPLATAVALPGVARARKWTLMEYIPGVFMDVD